MNEVTSYDIPKGNMPYLEAKFAEIVKKASKLHVTLPALTVVGEKRIVRKHPVTGFETEHFFVTVTITGEAPKLAGWSLVAVIEPVGSERILRVVPGQTCPEQYRAATLDCDHCHTDRQRKELFVLRHDDGRHVQVGRSCLADFLGGLSPETLVRWCEYINKAVADCLEASDEFGCMGGGGGRNGFSLDHFVKCASLIIRRFGWMSATKARELGDGVPTTAGYVVRLLTASPRDNVTKEWIKENDLYPEAKDSEEATAAIEWGKTLQGGTDYEHNLGVICRAGWLEGKNSGLAASLIAAYKRDKQKAEELRIIRETKTRGHVGTVGQRQGFEQLTCTKLHHIESDYGVRTLCRFEDKPGNIVIWWASGEPEWLKEGETYDITGTVKEHGDYKGMAQTQLQRVVPGLPVVKVSKRKKAAA